MAAGSTYKSPGLLEILTTSQIKDPTHVSELRGTVSSKHEPAGIIVELFLSVRRFEWL